MTLVATSLGSLSVGEGIYRQAPLIGKDTLVFATENKVKAYHFDTKNGDSFEKKWEYPGESDSSLQIPLSPMALSKDGVLAFGDENELHLFNVDTGERLCAPLPSKRITSLPVFNPKRDEVVITTRHATHYEVTNYDYSKGGLLKKWTFSPTQYAGPIIFTNDGKYLVMAAGNQSFYDGVARFQISAPDREPEKINAKPIAGYDNLVLIADAKSGEIKKRITVGSRAHSVGLSKSTVYAGVLKAVQAFGRKNWVVSSEREGFRVNSVLALEEGPARIIAATSLDQNPKIFAFDKDGAILWSAPYKKIAYSNGVLALANHSGVIFLDPEEGYNQDEHYNRNPLSVYSDISANKSGTFAFSDGRNVHLFAVKKNEIVSSESGQVALSA